MTLDDSQDIFQDTSANCKHVSFRFPFNALHFLLSEIFSEKPGLTLEHHRVDLSQ